MAQWLRLRAPNAVGPGFDPWSGNKIPHVSNKTQCSQINKNKIKKKKIELPYDLAISLLGI